MILLVVIASVLIAGVTIFQYKQQAERYHEERLTRKQEQLTANLDYTIMNTSWEPTTANLKYIFSYKDEIYKISDVQNVNFNIYDLSGNLIISSKPKVDYDSASYKLDDKILTQLEVSPSHSYVERKHAAGYDFRSSYVYINDTRFKPIGIVSIPYYVDDTFTNQELEEFLMRLGVIYVLMLAAAIFLSYFISKYITKSLKTIGDKLHQTRMNRVNEKIILDEASEEIYNLVVAYNEMVDELDESAAKLAKSEREQAWREMAKQVAHEIKNPLTPMRLSIQNFQRKFDPQDPNINQKVNEYSTTLIQQIDTMTSIASAFSSFANMPAQQNETLNVVKVVKLALDIFNEDYVVFKADKEEIIAKFDRTQLIRVITNLVKNAAQAIPEEREPKIFVSVTDDASEVKISVADNGCGIKPENHDRIFEPKFTTKNSGMGLGLGMVKNIVENYGGNIKFTSVVGKGTIFTLTFPK